MTLEQLLLQQKYLEGSRTDNAKLENAAVGTVLGLAPKVVKRVHPMGVLSLGGPACTVKPLPKLQECQQQVL